MMADPCYTTLLDGGELARRAEGALASLERCELCPRCCAVDRTADQTGECNTGRDARLCSAGPHFGEESPLVGTRGSGTLFFGGCNLNCDFCQNSEISQAVTGREADARDLADAMLGIQAMGCHNLNLVTPTHVTAQVLEALVIAAGRGLRLPVVYNCGGYESVDTLRWLDGVVDVYMPDLKFLDPEVAGRYCDAPDRWATSWWTRRRGWRSGACSCATWCFRAAGPRARRRCAFWPRRSPPTPT
jgi:putative pyruvate formate lyase activating enzyme